MVMLKKNQFNKNEIKKDIEVDIFKKETEKKKKTLKKNEMFVINGKKKKLNTKKTKNQDNEAVLKKTVRQAIKKKNIF